MNTCWPSTHRDAGRGQRGQHRHLGHVDAQRLVGQAVLAQHPDDLGRDVRGDAGVRVERAAQGGDAGPRAGPGRALGGGRAGGVVQPGVVELVVAGGRAEVPDDRLAAAGQQREPDQLVHGPGADVGRGHVADVGEVEAQQRAQFGSLQLRVQPGQPLRAEPAHIDAGLPVDGVRAEGLGDPHRHVLPLLATIVGSPPRSADRGRSAACPGALRSTPAGRLLSRLLNVGAVYSSG